MYMDKDLIVDELYQFIYRFNGKKLIIGIFILNYSTIYIHFMIEIGEGTGRASKFLLDGQPLSIL